MDEKTWKHGKMSEYQTVRNKTIWHNKMKGETEM